MKKLKKLIKKHYKRAIISIVSLVLLIPMFIIPASAQSLSFSPSESLIKCWSIHAPGSTSLTQTYSFTDSIHFDDWNVAATIPAGYGNFFYLFTKDIFLNMSAGEKIYCKFPLFFNNNGVNSSGDNIDECLWSVDIVYSYNGVEYVQSVSLGRMDIALGTYNIEFSFTLDNNCAEIKRFYITCASNNGNFYKTTWGASGFRALIGVADDIQIFTGGDIPSYAKPDGTAFNNYTDTENQINGANQAGITATNDMFSGFSGLLSGESSLSRGLMAATKIVNGFLDVDFLDSLINFALVLGIFAFFLGMGFFVGNMQRTSYDIRMERKRERQDMINSGRYIDKR